jgi:hypothetical protein
MDESMSSQVDLQALIDETEALGWDKPDQLDALVDAPPNQEAFAFVGKALSLKPLHTQLVRATLTAVWSFAAPLAMEVISPNKYLFAVPQQKHVDRIFQQGPWNIRGTLLLLQAWSPELTIDEIEPCLCSFWVQVHGLPHQSMTLRNAIKIGKAIGSLLDVENHDSTGLIRRASKWSWTPLNLCSQASIQYCWKNYILSPPSI